MKKILLFSLILTVVLTGCGKKKVEEEFVSEYVDEDTDMNNNSDIIDNSEEETEVGSLETYIESRYSKKGTLDIPYDEDTYSIEFDYDIPFIKDGSKVANDINDEIYALDKESIDLVEAILAGTAEEVYEPSYSKISYEASLNGEILSIIVTQNSSYTDWIEYGVYNYNVVTHEAVKNEEILEYLGVSEEEFINKAKKTFGAIALPDIDEFLSPEDEEEQADNLDTGNESENWRYRILADYLMDYVATVSDKNIGTDLPMYIDGNGELCSVALVYVPAGAGQYYNVARLEDTSNEAMLDKYCQYVEKFHYDGFEKGCFNLYDEEGYSTSIVRKKSLNNMSSEEVYIGFDSNDPAVFTMQFYGDDYGDVYLGTLSFDGIDENGISFSYELTEKNGEILEGDEQPHSGKFYFNAYNYYDRDKEDYVLGATYKYIDGEDMLDSDGDEVIFHKTYG